MVLQSRRREGTGWAARHGTRENRAADAPAPTFTGEAHRWTWSLRNNNQANATVRSLSEPAGTLFFGHRANECTWVADDRHGGDRGYAGSARAHPDHRPRGGLLQTFPADYPWAGNKGQQFSQIGNAVPPLLAGHLLAPHLGVTLDPNDGTLAADARRP
ncbi:DNA (cytosine-5-)-methyltransferase OS=Streptomyces microflavus OX=1919 GN=Smic_08740 PE=3 SV=1 [Streptomyces microflavus]